jgi:hypothetical protein
MRSNNDSTIKSVLLALLCSLALYSGTASALSDDAPLPVSVEIAFVDFHGDDDTLKDGNPLLSVTDTKSYTSHDRTRLLYITAHHGGRPRLNTNTVRGSPITAF